MGQRMCGSFRILCGEYKCETCGWNPYNGVREKRIEKVLDELATRKFNAAKKAQCAGSSGTPNGEV